MATWRYKTALLMLKNISLVPIAYSCNILQSSKRNFVSLHSHIISSIPTDMEKRSLVVTPHTRHCILNLMCTVISSHDQCDEQTSRLG